MVQKFTNTSIYICEKKMNFVNMTMDCMWQLVNQHEDKEVQEDFLPLRPTILFHPYQWDELISKSGMVGAIFHILNCK